MSGVLFEINPGAGWMVASHLRPDEAMRSFVAHDQVGTPWALVYGWRDGTPGVWHAENLGPGPVDRGEVIVDPVAAGFELMADLRTGPYERTVWTPRGALMLVRWSYA